MSESDGDLSFDRAAYGTGTETTALCGNCKGPLGAEYWHWLNHTVCANCRSQLAAMLKRSQSGAALGKAALLGGGTALGCGIAYAIFAALTHYQLALVTIGIAFLVAKVVRSASGGVGGRRFQVLAVALTYVASTMGYIPPIVNGLKEAAAEARKEAPAPAASSAQMHGAPEATSPVETERATSGETKTDASEVHAAAPPSLAGAFFSLLLALGYMFVLMLSAPFLELTSAPLGLLIVAFGLWEAWKLSRGLPLTLDGPYRVAPATTAPPAT